MPSERSERGGEGPDHVRLSRVRHATLVSTRAVIHFHGMLRGIYEHCFNGLIVTGVALLLLIPLSFFFHVRIKVPWPAQASALFVSDGVAQVWLVTHSDQPISFAYQAVKTQTPSWYAARDVVWPTVESGNTSSFRYSYAWLPLWLLCALCLAWPVTSFIITRRKHRRGFPVETKRAGDSVNTSAS